MPVFAYAMGMGYAEMIVVGLVALLCVGLPIVAVVFILLLQRRPGSGDVANNIMELRAEVGRLREEVERLKKGTP